MSIRVLSDDTINKIAAGEVIERPFSVVKELVENAIDAEATKINIALHRAGKNLIIVSDNGCGMDREDLLLSVKRHATSKLDESNLLNILSFGFRGEALPSIAAVSKLNIITKTSSQDLGYKLSIIAGVIDTQEVVATNTGTRVEVRDLFFSIPVRLKFLRTDRTELNLILQVIKKLALSYPMITFDVMHENKNILKLLSNDIVKDSPPDIIDKSFKDRVQNILGREFIENSVWVSHNRLGVKIYGYISLPTLHRASSEDQFLFVNNRPIKDRLLSIALKIAYQDLIMNNRYPLSVIFIELGSDLLDVNVHPAKTEVRFHDPNFIKMLMIESIKNALSSKSHVVSSTIADKALQLMADSGNMYYKPIVNEYSTISNEESLSDSKKMDVFREQNRSKDSSINNNSNKQNLFHVNYHSSSSLPVSKQKFRSNQEQQVQLQSILYQNIQPKSKSETVDDRYLEFMNYPMGAAKAQIYDSYIISQSSDSLIIIDQHAVDERINYEKIKSQISKNGLVKQMLLVPEIIELPDTERCMLIDQHKNDLAKLGLSLKMVGELSIQVLEIPSLISKKNIRTLILDIGDYLFSIGEEVALSKLIEHITETYACYHSIRANRVLSIDEMNAMLRQMEVTPSIAQCNHGRPTYVKLYLNDIEKLFARR
ncbi:DNA mismatch repair endonuclease MutL [Rickettsia endosymbiont of Cardiosporidium cionae]|uniref:DNA mismatch repair endonuclease MutL n=1 Tax=Rickettsia endosymbiont of Cardiosporidium cionae TaxID=2777155 RepID=UPI0018943B99|nr:DNA mismatch repair endonuclease MutL [Rickettsia endosymbiont of Cardiosporidium cionae]KAF8818219.1 DNA mismatch repair protein MutL [Rickettsia endosymbiont of Cardiosporidium cionae]